MAKWGEGDPRWIVEERPDAKNVNNWHWTEKNATPWSKEYFQQLFNEFRIVENDVECTINGVETCTGEATVNNRKGKLIFFYEWELLLKWSGQLKNSKKSHKGKITIPNLSEENGLNEVEITVTIDESNDESERLKLFMYNVGREKIRQQLGRYVKELKEEYSKNLILPKKCEDSPVVQSVTVKQNFRNVITQNAKPNSVSKEISIGYKLDVKTLTMSETFQCTANDLYNALTKAEMLIAFTRSTVKVDPIRGGEFVLYGGNVHGKFEELIPEKKIVQTWRLKSWPSGHFSHVSIEIEEAQNFTNMTLKQTGIPASEFDNMKTNWHRYYWHAVKQTFGFGAPLADAL